MWFSRRIFPELSYFESDEQRDAAERHAWRAIFKAWRFWLAVVMLILSGKVLVAVFPFVVFLALGIFDPGFRIPKILTLTVLFVLTAVPLLLFFQLGFRPLYRRSLQIELGKVGLSICVKCGYDLRASAERCPECGQAFE